ncbi:RING-H2 finger protein ATL52 [Cucumis sativus]|uniref:RING-type domain-containing protein n=1 Tax=Cucumis sativus TaxID=3659 RepID=A0A0A0KNT5_CUCSA|nr:RING-H2 finger protein ATL52 [Cucumis sativus]
MSSSTGDAAIYSRKLDIFLIAIGSAGAVVTIYHCIMACWCDRRRFLSGDQSSVNDPHTLPITDTPRSTENSVVHLIPAHKYEKRMAVDGGGGGKDVDGDGTCAICLSEFEEGEEIKTLPECKHSYHMPCIDMWLYSHSSCPMCRTNATPTSFNDRLQFETQSNSGIVVHVLPTRG